MVHVHQHLRCQVGAARHVGGKGLRIDQRFGALGQRIGNLAANEECGARCHQRTEGGGFIQWVAQHVLAGQFGEALDKHRVDFLVDVDAFHGAATLPGIEETAVHQIFHRMLKVGVCPDIGRVFSAELQAHAEKLSAGGAFHDLASLHGTGEVHLLHAPASNDRPGRHMVEQQILEQPLGQFCATHGLGKTLAHQQGLRCMFEDHTVAGHQRRDDCVHRGQVRVIPRSDHQHRAQRLAFDIALETRLGLRLYSGQGLWCDGDHVPGAFGKTAQFAGAVTHRAAHLPGQLRHDVGLHRQHCVHRGSAKRRAFAQ
ncbi:hypothetical protein D3C86_1359730 [compost metagenome]